MWLETITLYCFNIHTLKFFWWTFYTTATSSSLFFSTETVLFFKCSIDYNNFTTCVKSVPASTRLISSDVSATGVCRTQWQDVEGTFCEPRLYIFLKKSKLHRKPALQHKKMKRQPKAMTNNELFYCVFIFYTLFRNSQPVHFSPFSCALWKLSLHLSGILW